MAASGAWTTDNTCTLKACLYETAFCATFRLEFAGDLLLFDQETNVTFGPTKRPQLVGRLTAQVGSEKDRSTAGPQQASVR